MKRNILKLLYAWFDRELNPAEIKKLDRELEQSAELRQEKQEIDQLRRRVSQSKAASFEPGFSQRVMEMIESKPMEGNGTLMDIQRFYEYLLWSFRRVAAAGAAISIALLIYNLGIGDAFAMADRMSIFDISLFNIMDMPLF